MVTAEMANKNLTYLQMDDEYVNPVLARSFRIVAERGQGSYLYDMNGDAYLDFTTGIAVSNVGHCHPRVVEAVQQQAAQLMHTSVDTHHQGNIDLCKKIVDLTPPSLNSVFLANSGAEAVEGSIKLARYVTGRPGIINFRGSFHGRTFMTMALTTSKLNYREKYEPLPSSIFTLPYPYTYRSHFRGDPEACMEDCLKQFDALFNQLVHPEQIAAIIVEPVQGEGGYIVPPHSYLKRLRQVADKHKILLIVDEVQTGFGRTGKMFAIEHSDVEPDIMVMAKGIAGGMPLSGFISRKELTTKWPAGRHGTTFGGNPVSCAAALATIDVLQEEKLPERAARLGKVILERLQKAAQGKEHIGEVRGLGFMIAIEFNDREGNPGKEAAEKAVAKCFENKLLVLTAGSHAHVIRLIPPLNLSDDEAESAIKILEQCMSV